MKISETREQQNKRSLARLAKAMPATFPGPVRIYALNCRWIPPMPRLAVDGYWRKHPLRADRLTRALARRSGTRAGWRWTLRSSSEGDATFRSPPTPYREKAFSRGPGFCCVCGQPVYCLGWHVDLWGDGPNRNAVWHASCVTTWRLWTSPSNHIMHLKRLQSHRCAETGARLWKTAEIDHCEPLFRRLARASQPRLARAAFILGTAEPACHQSRRAREKVWRGGCVATAKQYGIVIRTRRVRF